MGNAVDPRFLRLSVATMGLEDSARRNNRSPLGNSTSVSSIALRLGDRDQPRGWAAPEFVPSGVTSEELHGNKNCTKSLINPDSLAFFRDGMGTYAGANRPFLPCRCRQLVRKMGISMGLTELQ